MSSYATPSMLFCPNCDKPFTKDQQYKRHTSYCSKSHTARKRQRSCRACSTAKVKCDFVPTGCATCVKRSIECVYDSRRRVVPEPAGKGDDKTSVMEGVTSLTSNTSAPHSALQESSVSSSGNDDLTLQPYSTSREIPMMMIEMDTLDFLTPTETFNLDFLQESNFNYANGKEMQPSFHTPPPTFSPLSPISSFLSLPSPSHFECKTGRTNVQQVFLTMMIDMIQAYPRMMTNLSNPPPIIHHYFLASSPILQTCSALSHLFTIRNPSSRSFVWGSIWTTVRELGKSATENTLSRDEIISATVASLVYLVMRAIDGDGEGEGSDWEMLMIYEGIKNRLMEITQHVPWIVAAEGEVEPEPTWKDWIFLESVYRIGCIWFLLKLVFHIKTEGPCFVSDFYREIHLPCTKGEWEARTEEQWRSERAAAITARKDGLQTFGDLIDAQSSRGGNHKSLEVWIAGIDNLGMLLNLAVQLV